MSTVAEDSPSRP